jgi:hypothetical protein
LEIPERIVLTSIPKLGSGAKQFVHNLCGNWAMTTKALSVSEFKTLSQPNQIDLLHRNGAYIGKRKMGNRVWILIQLNDFYVEIAYLSYRRHIASMRFSNSLEILNLYLDQVDICGVAESYGK